MHFKDLWKVKERIYFLTLKGLVVQLKSIELQSQNGWDGPKGHVLLDKYLLPALFT
jgi:hypothetical protein